MIHPAIVEGVGGRKGGGWVDTADRAVVVEEVAAAAAAAAAASDRAETAEVAEEAAEFRPIEDEAADVRLRARDGARPLAMVDDSRPFRVVKVGGQTQSG